MRKKAEKSRKRMPFLAKWALRLFLAFALLLGLFLAGVMIYAKIAGPPPLMVPQTTVYYDSSHHVIGKQEHQNQNRYWIKLDEMAKPIREATVDIEDKRFYQHHGFDVRRIGAAVLKDIATLSKKEGAGTITMQYARNLFLTHEKSWGRKFMEALYTVRLEMNYSKDDILAGYLNTIYYGHGAYGIEAASKYYFDKDAKDLTLAEATMLVGIPKGPSYYEPYDHFSNAKKRQKLILNAMAANGDISREQADAAANATLDFVSEHNLEKEKAPYFQDTVESVLKNKLHIDEKTLVTGGLKVYTTLDSDTQESTQKWVEEELRTNKKIQTAVVAMDPVTGAVKALLGGRDYAASQYNRATMAKRQPGSSFKPFLYYAALKDGYTPSTMLKSEPTTFKYNNGNSTYKPGNFGGYYAGRPISMLEALAVSDNIYAVKTTLAIGLDQLPEAAHEMGITSRLAEIPSLALGTKPVHVLEMARAYSTIANDGARVKPHFIKKVVDHKGNVLYEWHPEKKQVLDPATTFVLSQMMTGVFDDRLSSYEAVTGSLVSDELTHKMAAKTGTTDTDSWMVGFTPDLVTAVWVGYDENRPLKTYPDTRYAREIWAHVMEDALQGKPENAFDPPKGVVKVKIDPHTGKLATANCPDARVTYYVKGTEPDDYCDKHGFFDRFRPDEKEKKSEDSNWLDRFFSLFH